MAVIGVPTERRRSEGTRCNRAQPGASGFPPFFQEKMESPVGGETLNLYIPNNGSARHISVANRFKSSVQIPRADPFARVMLIRFSAFTAAPFVLANGGNRFAPRLALTASEFLHFGTAPWARR